MAKFFIGLVYVKVNKIDITEGEAGRSRPRCLMFFGRGRLMAHLDRRRGFGVGGGRGVFGRGGSRWGGGRRGGRG